MKIIENTCSQPRRYADSEGWLKIELEQGDDREAIIQQYNKSSNWGRTTTFCPSLSSDTILVFKNHEPFLD